MKRENNEALSEMPPPKRGSPAAFGAPVWRMRFERSGIRRQRRSAEHAVARHSADDQRRPERISAETALLPNRNPETGQKIYASVAQIATRSARDQFQQEALAAIDKLLGRVPP
jgi:hypothetical protein